LKFIIPLITCIILIYSEHSTANSAARLAGESFLSASERSLSSIKVKEKNTAFSKAMSFDQLDSSKVPEVESLEKLNSIFLYLRNLKFMKNIGEKEIRRLSWFYPDNGCWLKAELMKENLKKFNSLKVGKVFIFGDLNVKTNFSPEGEVTWWYHVVPVLRVKNEVYAIDPTLNQSGPLKIKDWALLQTDDINSAKFNFCHANTFGPHSRCKRRLKEIQILVKTTQMDYLVKEKKRLKELGLDIETHLGDNPPWEE